MQNLVKNRLYFFPILMLIFSLVSCLENKPRYPVSPPKISISKESIIRNSSQYQAEKELILNYIKLDSLNTYQSNPNGYWYSYEKKNNSKITPEISDEVEFSFQVFALNNQLIYDFDDNGIRKYKIDKEEIISGIQDGIKIMKEGEIVKFLFPSFRAYGYLGDRNKIGINQPLIYKVRLLKIMKIND